MYVRELGIPNRKNSKEEKRAIFVIYEGTGNTEKEGQLRKERFSLIFMGVGNTELQKAFRRKEIM